MAVEHSIPLDEPTTGHVSSRKCPCNPHKSTILGGTVIHHQYMNNQEKVPGDVDAN